MDYDEVLFEEGILKESSSKLAKNKGYKCSKCNREFTLSSNLTRHMRHNKVCGISNGFECANCHKVFSLNATMKDHYARCIAEDPYRFPCPNCPKQFTFKSSLNKHLRGRCRTLKKKSLNKNINVHACKYCAAEFYDVYICQKHEKSGSCTIETESQPHVCPHCARNFTMKSSLTKHLKGRCKLMKPNFEINDNESEAEYMYTQHTSSSNETEDVEVYEAWFDDVIEECEDEIDDIISDHVESYVEISDESIADNRNKFKYEIDEVLSTQNYIKIDTSNL